RFPPIRERPACRLRDGHGATHPVDLQARTYPRCSALPADARPLLSLVRILLGPHRLFGRMGDLPEDDPFAALLTDHPDFVDKLTELDATRELEADASWAAIQETNRHGIFLVQFLWDHFRKERMSLFPTARERLPAADLERIRKRFAP